MNEDEATNPANPGVREEKEVLPRALVWRVLLITVAVTGVLCGAAWILFLFRIEALRPSRDFPEHRVEVPTEIANVRQDIYDVARPGPTWREEQRRALAGYAWRDRARGIVTIPIERAMQLVAEEARIRERAP